MYILCPTNVAYPKARVHMQVLVAATPDSLVLPGCIRGPAYIQGRLVYIA